jgi:hypothetical protein
MTNQPHKGWYTTLRSGAGTNKATRLIRMTFWSELL